MSLDYVRLMSKSLVKCFVQAMTHQVNLPLDLNSYLTLLKSLIFRYFDMI